MDRLPALSAAGAGAAGVLLALGLLACNGGDKAAPANSRSRVNAVAAKPKAAPDLNELCETVPTAAEAPTFSSPALATGTLPASGWRWINVWATWCKPCVSEIPMLKRWEKRLAEDDIALPLTFLSVDADEATVASFREQHTDIPESLRIADAEQLAPWLASMGLKDTSVLPIHMFVDSQDKLRCVRMGELSEADYELVEHLARQ